MTERIEKVELDSETGFNLLFLDGPVEFLVKAISTELLKVTQFVEIFGENIDPYKRMDYGYRNLPALRIYNDAILKEFDSWFITGDIKADLIFPASLRRNETQQFQDTVSHALLQQFRRTNFFNAVTEAVPGLNELGKRFEVNKQLGFEWQDEVVPLTQITLNFRLDLRIWDEYLVSDNRTKEDPFERTLADLKRIVAEFQGLHDNGNKEVTIPYDQKL